MRATSASLLVALAGLALLTPAKALDLKKSARSGAVTLMGRYTNWTADCQSRTGIIRLVAKPAHGTLSTRQAMGHATFNRFNPADPCLGRKVHQFVIEYRSRPGFRGQDTFSVMAIWGGSGNLQATDTYTVDVQ